MCGISGFIGNSKDPELSFILSSKLFEQIEIRGKDSAGVWASNQKKQIFYHKEPVQSSVFVKNSFWKKIKKFNANIMLCHARKASAGVGVPTTNKNNHPFVSNDKKTALIHNGRVHDLEYEYLTQYYSVNGDCDSEILLRVFENSENDLAAIENIWTFSSMAMMAVAIAKNEADRQRLYLFRNQYRPICVLDLQDCLGQIFFCSTPQIWENCLLDRKIRNLLKKRVKLINLPTEEVWFFELFSEIKKEIYEIKPTNKFKTLKGQPKTLLKPPVRLLNAISGLDDQEEPLNRKPLKNDCKAPEQGPINPYFNNKFWCHQKDKMLLGCEFQN